MFTTCISVDSQRNPYKKHNFFYFLVGNTSFAVKANHTRSKSVENTRQISLNHPLAKKMLRSANRSIRRLEMNISHSTLTSIENLRDSALLRQASGYIELAEFNMTPENSVSTPAKKLLQNAIELLDRLSPAHDSGNALILRAEALRALCHFSDALPYYQRLVCKNPHSVAGWLGFGWCLKRSGKLSEAIDVLADGMNYCDKEPALAYNLSCYHSLAGNVRTAVEYLTKAIASDNRFRSLTSYESDFDSIRNDPQFVAVIEQTV